MSIFSEGRFSFLQTALSDMFFFNFIDFEFFIDHFLTKNDAENTIFNPQ